MPPTLYLLSRRLLPQSRPTSCPPHEYAFTYMLRSRAIVTAPRVVSKLCQRYAGEQIVRVCPAGP
jgi:hypothetical protein